MINDEGGAVSIVVPVTVVALDKEAEVEAVEAAEKLAEVAAAAAADVEDADEAEEWPCCRCCCHCNRSIQRRRSKEIGVPAAAVIDDGDAAVIDAERTDGATVESVVEAVRDEEIDVRNDCDNVDHDERCA